MRTAILVLVLLGLSTALAAIASDSDSWTAYRNGRYCYQIRYPAEAETPTSDSIATFVLTRPDRYGNTYAFRFDIWVRSNRGRLSVRDWVREEEAASRDSAAAASDQDRVLQRKSTHVGKHAAIRLRMADLDHGRDIVYVARDTIIYVLMFPRPLPSLIESQTLSRAFESMLDSFEFVEAPCRPAKGP